jgi:hypothetical protein
MLGGLVTVRAGAKENTLENITNNLSYKMALKTDLVLNYIDILELGQEKDQENYINRTAITLRSQQPFLDWYSNLNPEEDFKEIKIYLIDDSINEPGKWLKKKFDKFFMMELGERHTNKKEWPQKRNYKMFTLWFRVEISENIYDLEKNPILKSE